MLSLLSCSACLDQSYEYNEDRAALTCHLAEQPECRAWQYAQARGEGCEEELLLRLDDCAAECTYDRKAARQCIRDLRSAVWPGEPDCALSDVDLGVCAQVYTECPQSQACAIEAPQLPPSGGGCRIAEQSPLWWLVVFGIAGRRRRRS